MKQLKRLQNLQLQQLATEATAESTQSTESTQSEDTQATNTNLSSSEALPKKKSRNVRSSGSYTAQNGQYYGRYQLASSYLNGDLSPENQEKVADNYVASRYGSWTALLLSGMLMVGTKSLLLTYEEN